MRMQVFGRASPWVKGFQPPSKCPRCKRVNSLVFTGDRAKNGDHIYKCVIPLCNSMVGSPSMYGWCTRFNQIERLERDVFYNPCVSCSYRAPLSTDRPGGGVCRYLRVRPYEEFV